MTPTTELVQIDRITRLRLTAMAANLRTLAGYSPALRELGIVKKDGEPVESNIPALLECLSALRVETNAIDTSALNLIDQLSSTSF